MKIIYISDFWPKSKSVHSSSYFASDGLGVYSSLIYVNTPAGAGAFTSLVWAKSSNDITLGSYIGSASSALFGFWSGLNIFTFPFEAVFTPSIICSFS